MWQQNSWWFCFFISLPLPFFKILPSRCIPQRKPNQQYFHKTWLRLMNIMLSVKADQLYRRTAFKRSRKLIWAAERAGMGRSRKKLSWGGKRSTESWMLLVTYWQFHLIAQIYERGEHLSGRTFSLFYESLSIWETITQGKVRPYSLARAQLQGNDVSFPPPTSPSSANPPLPWPVNTPLPQSLPCRAPGKLSVSYCATESTCQGMRSIFVLRKVFNEKANVSPSKIMLSQQKLGQAPEKLILNRIEVMNAI